MSSADLPPHDPMGLLILRIAATGDRQAFAALFDHFAPRVKTYMRRLGAADPLAEDLAQDTLLAVWRKAASFDPSRARAATWVFTIARNLRIDALRRDPARETVSADELSEQPDDLQGADNVLITAERDNSLRLALAALPPEQMQVLELAFYGDKPHSEIERTLGIPLGTVKSRMRMAIKRLRAALEDRP